MNRNEISALTARAQSGDKDAFEKLYNEFSDKIYFFAKRNTNSTEAAEDITSETFVTALERIGELRSEESFIGWLYSIAYSKCAKHHKESSRTEHYEDAEQLEKAVNDASLDEPVMLPEDYAVNNETRERLKSVIDGLSPELRSAVILYYYEDMSVAEVARTLGINENNAKQKLFKARKTIRKKIEKFIGSGVMLAAVPLQSLLSNTADASYAHAAAVGSARAAGTSLAVKIAAFGAAAAVAVGVPFALSRVGDSKGDYRPREDSSIAQNYASPATIVTENEHLRMTFEVKACDDKMIMGRLRIEGLDDEGREHIDHERRLWDFLMSLDTTEGMQESLAQAYYDKYEEDMHYSILPFVGYKDENGDWHSVGTSGADDKSLLVDGIFTGKFYMSIDRPNAPESMTFSLLDYNSLQGGGLDGLEPGIFEGMSLTLDLSPTVPTYYYKSESGKRIAMSEYGLYTDNGREECDVRFDGSEDYVTVNSGDWYYRTYTPENVTEIEYLSEVYHRE